jgi:hypothetical protein
LRRGGGWPPSPRGWCPRRAHRGWCCGSRGRRSRRGRPGSR